jgi:hypothetical protein
MDNIRLCYHEDVVLQFEAVMSWVEGEQSRSGKEVKSRDEGVDEKTEQVVNPISEKTRERSGHLRSNSEAMEDENL